MGLGLIRKAQIPYVFSAIADGVLQNLRAAASCAGLEIGSGAAATDVLALFIVPASYGDFCYLVSEISEDSRAAQLARKC